VIDNAPTLQCARCCCRQTPPLKFLQVPELKFPRQLSLPIERDEHFDADKALSSYAEEARQCGHIVA
jgi:hypothetical protein